MNLDKGKIKVIVDYFSVLSILKAYILGLYVLSKKGRKDCGPRGIHLGNHFLFVVTISSLALGNITNAQTPSTTPHPFNITNQNGRFYLTSIPPADSTKALTVVFSKKDSAELYRFPLFLDEFVGLSQDGRKIVNYLSRSPFINEGEKQDSSVVIFMADGNIRGMVTLAPIISSRLNELGKTRGGKLIGMVENDSIIHQMALHPFYIDDDKVFISTSPMRLTAFNLQTGKLLYNGPGRAHFTENYYSIPVPQHRKLLSEEEMKVVLAKE